MKKLWQKDYKQNEIAEAYCFGNSEILDNKLITYDVIGSIAHAKMLSSIGILKEGEFIVLKKTLCQILNLEKQGKFQIQLGDEDVHTKVENYLIEKLHSLGEKIHTGRSRNDQILVDLRLYSKENLFVIAESALEMAKNFIGFAQKYEFVPMPGYTHMQKAMPSSVGMWAGSFAESILDDLECLKSAFEINDQNPLGSGASYGVSLPINRNLTSKLLGFSKTQNNSLYCQASRGKGHLFILGGLTQIMLTLSRFAQDMLIFTTSEFNFFNVEKELCTGSSIMPQKKNLDVMEIIRAKTHEVINYQQLIASITSGLPSGYNADFGETKEPFIKAIETTHKTLNLVNKVIGLISPNATILEKACSVELFATHAAYLLVKKGMPFRQAYKEVGLNLDKLPTFDPVKILEASNHVGGPGNLDLLKATTKISKEKKYWSKKSTYYKLAIRKLKGGEYNEK